MTYLFRKAHGGWILQYGVDEEAEEEVFSDGRGLVTKLADLVGLHDAQDSAGEAAQEAITKMQKETRKRAKLDG